MKQSITIFPSSALETSNTPLSRLTYSYDDPMLEPHASRPASPCPANDVTSHQLGRERALSLSIIESLNPSSLLGLSEDEDEEEGTYGKAYNYNEIEEEACGHGDEYKAAWQNRKHRQQTTLQTQTIQMVPTLKVETVKGEEKQKEKKQEKQEKDKQKETQEGDWKKKKMGTKQENGKHTRETPAADDNFSVVQTNAASEVLPTETEMQATPQSDGPRPGQKGWWTSVLGSSVPVPDVPTEKSASFSLLSILPTPPPVVEVARHSFFGQEGRCR